MLTTEDTKKQQINSAIFLLSLNTVATIPEELFGDFLLELVGAGYLEILTNETKSKNGMLSITYRVLKDMSFMVNKGMKQQFFHRPVNSAFVHTTKQE